MNGLLNKKVAGAGGLEKEYSVRGRDKGYCVKRRT